MGFYDLNREQRLQLVDKINKDILVNIHKEKNGNIFNYFSDEDTYIRKTAYQAIGKTYKENKNLQSKNLKLLDTIFKSNNEKVSLCCLSDNN